MFSCFFVVLVIFVVVKNWMLKSHNMVNLEIRFSSFPRAYWGVLFVFDCCRLALYQESLWGTTLNSPQVFAEFVPSSGYVWWLSKFPCSYFFNVWLPKGETDKNEGRKGKKRCQPDRSPSAWGRRVYTIVCVCVHARAHSTMAAFLCVSTSVIRSSNQLSEHRSLNTRSLLPTFAPIATPGTNVQPHGTVLGWVEDG